jgi:hypothetical protein
MEDSSRRANIEIGQMNIGRMEVVEETNIVLDCRFAVSLCHLSSLGC